VFGRKKRPRRPDKGDSAGPGPYEGLRTMALDAAARGLVSASPESPDVSGVVVDVPGSGGFATIVALADGTTSMYTSTGGGRIGAGTHAHVAVATAKLLAEVQRHLGLFGAPDDRGLPESSAGRHLSDQHRVPTQRIAADPRHCRNMRSAHNTRHRTTAAHPQLNRPERIWGSSRTGDVAARTAIRSRIPSPISRECRARIAGPGRAPSA
jgi:hypothetical protein